MQPLLKAGTCCHVTIAHFLTGQPGGAGTRWEFHATRVDLEVGAPGPGDDRHPFTVAGLASSRPQARQPTAAECMAHAVLRGDMVAARLLADLVLMGDG